MSANQKLLYGTMNKITTIQRQAEIIVRGQKTRAFNVEDLGNLQPQIDLLNQEVQIIIYNLEDLSGYTYVTTYDLSSRILVIEGLSALVGNIDFGNIGNVRYISEISANLWDLSGFTYTNVTRLSNDVFTLSGELNATNLLLTDVDDRQTASNIRLNNLSFSFNDLSYNVYDLSYNVYDLSTVYYETSYALNDISYAVYDISSNFYIVSDGFNDISGQYYASNILLNDVAIGFYDISGQFNDLSSNYYIDNYSLNDLSMNFYDLSTNFYLADAGLNDLSTNFYDLSTNFYVTDAGLNDLSTNFYDLSNNFYVADFALNELSMNFYDVSGKYYDLSDNLYNHPIQISGNLTIVNGLTVYGNTYSTAFYSTSDSRIKTNITPLNTVSIQDTFVVDQLNPVFYYNKITHKDDIGFIAQEVEEHFPFMVNDSNEYKTLNYTSIIGILVKEIQELKQRVSFLERG